MAHDVFICHASEDAATANAVCASLEAAGVSCWIAPRDPVPGIPYGRQLVDAIADCRVLLLLLSRQSNQSHAVLNEVELAEHRKKIILPVFIETVSPSPDLEFYVRSVHWLDAVGKPIAQTAKELFSQLKGLIDLSDRSAGFEPPREAVSRTNVPAQISSFVGRDTEIARLGKLLEEHRLVSLLGTGGIGKTRLALRVGDESNTAFGDGVWFIEFAPVTDGRQVASTIAAAANVPQSPHLSTLDNLLQYFKRETALLIFDNCEHLVAEVARVAGALLRSCPHVKILATSREPLNVAGEQTYRIPTLEPAQALALFVERAKAVNQRFSLTPETAQLAADVCRRLDGLPLAIELAAARMGALTVKALAEKLDDRFTILGSGNRTSVPHQQTLHALIDWSYELLMADEQTLFRRLAIFAGGFPLDLAVAVCADDALSELDIVDLLGTLVDKSLVTAEFSDDEPRYDLLESLREYAREKLDAGGETPAAARAHALAFTEFAERLEAQLESMTESDWRRIAKPELENWRAALSWAFGGDGVASVGRRSVAALRPVWCKFAVREGHRWIRTALLAQDAPGEITARLLIADAHLYVSTSQYREAADAARKALELLPKSDGLLKAQAEMFAGAALAPLGGGVEAEELLRTALDTFRRLGARQFIGATLQYLGALKFSDETTARAYFEEALEIFRSVPSGEQSAAHLALGLAELEFRYGSAAKALELANEGLATDRSFRNDDSVVFDLCNIAAYHLALEQCAQARSAAWEALSLARQNELEVGVLLALQHLGAITACEAKSGKCAAERLRPAAAAIGFVDKRFSEMGFTRFYTEQREYESATSALRHILGDAELIAALDAGKILTEEAAVAAVVTE